MLQELFQVRDAFLHMNIAFPAFELIFFLQAVTPLVLDDLGMWAQLKFAEQLHFLPEYKFAHIIFKSHLLHAFHIAILILHLIDIWVALHDHFFPADGILLV